MGSEMCIRDRVKEIAYLARLNVSDSELVKSTEELNNILNLMEELGDIDTGEIEPMAHPLHMSQRLRTDEVTETDLSKEFQEIAPKKGKDHFLVPTVIE